MRKELPDWFTHDSLVEIIDEMASDERFGHAAVDRSACVWAVLVTVIKVLCCCRIRLIRVHENDVGILQDGNLAL